MRFMKIKILVPAFTALLFSISCKKNNNNAPDSPSANGTVEEKIMDSVYLYSKEVYYWNDLIPSYSDFNPRQYKGSSELSSAQNVMTAIRGLQGKDRYSFVTTLEESNGIQTGQDKDFGFFIKASSIDKADPIDSVYWFVTYVYDQSTAGQSGVKRGWRINKINGSQINYDQASVNTLNDVFFGSATAASFEFIKEDGSTATSSLNKSSFQSNSVLYKTVFTSGAKKIGYFVFNQFFGAYSRNELASAFADFESAGINELIVDLRYNRGGSTETQDTLADLIAPQSADNQKMYSLQFNTQLQQGIFPLLKQKPGFGNTSFAEGINTVKFNKAGSLNLSRVFFIVSSSSASASELLINNLKPYMDVKLVGDTTYGKPVGFFPIEISNYAIYPISFRTVNSAGNADYYSGFAPDKIVTDGVDKDWGDVGEPCLAAALKYINTGSFRLSSDDYINSLRKKVQDNMQPVQKQLELNKFSGMYRERK